MCPPEDAVCILFLVVRAVDTVEDDMTISLETKIPMLRNFHTYLYQADWRFTESKDKHRQVLEDFPTISQEFRKLPAVYQEVIADTCHKMEMCMAEFLEKRMEFLLDWDRYCHYVSVSVMIGVSRLFSAAELEDAPVVWSKYSKNLSDLAKPENIVPAVQCLNDLVTNALQHIPDFLLYLSRLRNQSEFNFFAVSQLMYFATLATCYNNPQVFKRAIYQKIPVSDPSAERTQNIVSTIQKMCLSDGPVVSRHRFSPIYLPCAALLAVLSWQYLSSL
ncbi:hypothetical protein GDO78_015760 [Eleutherodactylus coqui]|uniref:Squalene synthase n=1 Tax=Eleutherodactylus coqui TaxID=57060 RepID=A0A8J6EDB8_ELECQ|nr:hypothetical protein GDO78_015760 [Eleutherodactylus coqui]